MKLSGEFQFIAGALTLSLGTSNAVAPAGSAMIRVKMGGTKGGTECQTRMAGRLLVLL
jgi:hypothetical protein